MRLLSASPSPAGEMFGAWGVAMPGEIGRWSRQERPIGWNRVCTHHDMGEAMTLSVQGAPLAAMKRMHHNLLPTADITAQACAIASTATLMQVDPVQLPHATAGQPDRAS